MPIPSAVPAVGPCPNVDLGSDPLSCGACGHSCLGGACTAGACQPFEVAQEPSKVLGVLANDDYVVWRAMDDAGATWALHARSWESPAVVTLASGDYVMRPMALSGSYVYWCEDDHVARVLAPGNGVERFAETKEKCVSLEADDKEVFWSTNDGVVHAKPHELGAERRLVGLAEASWYLKLSGDSILAYDGSRTARIPRGGQTYVFLEGFPENLTIVGDDLYLTESYVEPGPVNPKNGIEGSRWEAVVRTKLAPGAPRVRIADKQMSAGIIGVVDGYLYWGDGGIYTNPVDLRRVRLPKGRVETLVTVPWSSGGWSVEGRRIVWHDGDAHVMRALAK